MAQTIDMRGILLGNSSSTIFASNYRLGDRPAGVGNSWKIASAYRTDTMLPMVAVHPRPDLADPVAAWRWFTTKVDNTIRLCWQGGEGPFKISMTTSPTGATIGSSGTEQVFTRTADPVVAGVYRHSLPESYAVIKMPAASVTNLSSYNFVVTVTDQTDAVITFTFTVTADDSKFKFFDSVNGSDANPGTFASPYKTWLQGYTLSGRAGFIYMFKNGTYTITDGSGGNPQILDTRCRSFIGIGTNASSVIFNMNTGTLVGAVGDFTVRNLTLSGGPSVNNPKQIMMGGQSHRMHICNVKFDTRGGLTGDDNPCGIFMADLGATFRHRHISVVDSEVVPTAGAPMIIYYSCQYAIEENCFADNVTFPGSPTSLISHQKGRVNDITYRFCDYAADSPNGIVWVSNQDADDSRNAEIVFCRFRNIGTANASVLRFNGQALLGSRPAGQATIRCSINANTTDPFNFENFISGPDVGYGGILWSSDIGSTIDNTGGTPLTVSSVKVADINTIASGDLGVRGWVIASTEVL